MWYARATTRPGFKGCESVFRPCPWRRDGRQRGGRQSGRDRSVAIEKRITARHRESLRGSQCRSHVTILFELCRRPLSSSLSRPLHIPHCSACSLSRPMSTSYARFRPRSVMLAQCSAREATAFEEESADCCCASKSGTIPWAPNVAWLQPNGSFNGTLTRIGRGKLAGLFCRLLNNI